MKRRVFSFANHDRRVPHERHQPRTQTRETVHRRFPMARGGAGLPRFALLALSLCAWCLVPSTATSGDVAPSLCACQRENEYAACIAEVAAACASWGEHAASQPMCLDYVANGNALEQHAVLNPATFMAVIKASAAFCKHPYLFSVAEMSSFLGATGFGDAKSAFEAGRVTGAHMTRLTLDQLVHSLDMPLGRAMDFKEGQESFLKPGALVNVDAMRGRDKQTAQMAFNVKAVSKIDEVDFSFEAEIDILMHWSDSNVWADCNAGGDQIDQGTCKYVWRPRLLFLNARELEYDASSMYLWADVRAKAVTFQVAARGVFSAPMSFVKFPADEQRLPITVTIADDEGGEYAYADFFWRPVSARLDARVADPKDGKDIISGWTLAGATAFEHPTIALDWSTLAGESGPMRAYIDDMMAYYERTMNLTMDVDAASTTSAVTCEVIVRRTTVFYMINYILVVVLLTSLSWVVFIMPRDDLAGRAGMSLTLLLALNVFQLILSELMPKTAYLTPMHEFVIVSTFFTVFAAFESVVVRELQTRGEKMDESGGEEEPEPDGRAGDRKPAHSARGDVALELSGEVEETRGDAGGERRKLGAKLLGAAKVIDRASLVGFPVVYAAYTAYVFGPTRGG